MIGGLYGYLDDEINGSTPRKGTNMENVKFDYDKHWHVELEKKQHMFIAEASKSSSELEDYLD